MVARSADPPSPVHTEDGSKGTVESWYVLGTNSVTEVARM